MEEDFLEKTVQLNEMPPEPPVNPLDIPSVSVIISKVKIIAGFQQR